MITPAGLITRKYSNDKYYQVRNGSQIIYGGLGGSEDRDKIKSMELGAFAIDEATETSEDMFKLLQTRLRWRLPDGSRPAYHGLLATNPEPGWVKDRFVTQRRPGYRFIPALPRDNPHLPEDYVSGLRIDWEHASPEWIRRYLDGSWDVFEGQIYHEFSRDKHVYRDIQISEWWERFRVIDHGYTNPTCCLWIAIDQDGRLLVYDEHYERELTIGQNAAAIHAKEPDFDGVTLMDPSMFSTSSTKDGKPWSYADEYAENGIYGTKPSQDRISEGVGIQLVKQRLKSDSLLIHEKCINTIAEIVKYRWRDLKPHAQMHQNLPEAPVDKDNHAMDDIRYACMYKPLASVRPDPPLDPRSVRYAIMKHKESLNKGHYAGWN